MNSDSIFCIICRNSLKKWFEKRGRTYSRCQTCSFITIPDGVLEEENGLSIYEGQDPIFFQDGNESYYLDETNALSAQSKLMWIRDLIPLGSRHLDIGANFGHFIFETKKDFDSTGIEISQKAVDWGRSNLKVSLNQMSIYDLSPDKFQPFDMVTLWDVIEHLADPISALKKINGILRNDGWLFLSTPNAGSFVGRALGRLWYYLDPIQHISIFNQENLADSLKQAGFEVQEYRSMTHHYRIEYIFNRLKSLYRNKLFRFLIFCLSITFIPFKNLKLPINFGDVMGVAAKKTRENTN